MSDRQWEIFSVVTLAVMSVATAGVGLCIIWFVSADLVSAWWLLAAPPITAAAIWEGWTTRVEASELIEAWH